MGERNGMQNDLPMATRDAMETLLPDSRKDGSGVIERSSDVIIGLCQRVDSLEIRMIDVETRDRLFRLDMDATRNRVTNLLERMEPRVALVEEVLIEMGKLIRNDKGQLAKAVPQESSSAKPQKSSRRKHAAKR